MTTDPRPLYTRATAQAARLLEAVRPEQLSAPTPCAEYDVRALLGHIVGGTRGIAAVGETGTERGEPVAAPEVPDDGWAGAYGEVRERALKAWESDERMASSVTVPWGKIPGRAALSAFVMETVAHTWDLSEAIGRPFALDPELAEFSLATAREALPEGPREGRPFGAPVPAPEGAGAYERLAAWLGRVPLSRA
ncbi:TIGR03086 family metal-binding protein [Streptomyces sp. CSDS2]|uniref:TIGR03086 family metal-binding protein n=1 Tax=Streptomyces sp. CSDS2 TaxID=3055051 RepID=UPI0025B158E3|nr:TIGR03086 family metal-binding protein [Streptomyces sp. CSDS2]MDN3262068.1 TIGR03086 family metal-binding protein [Streptomyces sp. CSDS2]